MNRINPEQIVFVTGVGRSGTSLLQSMLNAHPGLRALPETKFFKKYVLPEYLNGQYDDNPDFSADLLRQDNHFVLTESIGESVLQELENSTSASYGKAYELLLLRYLESADGLLGVIAKDPLFINFPEVLEQVFPGAHLVQIIRDPRDVILSRKKSGWGKKESLAQHLYETKYGLERSQYLGESYFRAAFHALKYEDLVANPVHTLEALCAFLGLPFAEAMLTYYKSSDTLFDENRETWKKNIKQPILKGNTNKWKNELSASEVYLIEHFLHQDFVRLQYDLSSGGATLLIKVQLFLLRLGYPLYRMLKKMKRKRSK